MYLIIIFYFRLLGYINLVFLYLFKRVIIKKNDYIYYEAGFVEIIKIFNLDFIFGYYITQ